MQDGLEEEEVLEFKMGVEDDDEVWFVEGDLVVVIEAEGGGGGGAEDRGEGGGNEKRRYGGGGSEGGGGGEGASLEGRSLRRFGG